jgi:hypothetical protein
MPRHVKWMRETGNCLRHAKSSFPFVRPFAGRFRPARILSLCSPIQEVRRLPERSLIAFWPRRRTPIAYGFPCCAWLA